MSSEHVVWVGVVVVLLVIGLLIGWQFLPRLDDAGVVQGPGQSWRVEGQRPEPVEGQRPEQSRRVEASFRQWFWESRSLDLAVQVGLIFVAALGVLALLRDGK